MSRRLNQFNFKDLFTSNPEELLGGKCASDSAVDSASQGNSQYNYSQTDQLFDSQDGQQISHSQNFPAANDSPTTRFFNRYMQRAAASASTREGCQPAFGKPFAAAGIGLPRRPSQQQVQLFRTKSQELDENRDLWNCLISSIKECSAEVRVAVACLKENTQLSLGATECKLTTFAESIHSNLEKNRKSIFDVISGHENSRKEENELQLQLATKDSKIEELEKVVQRLEKEKQECLSLTHLSAREDLCRRMTDALETHVLQNRKFLTELFSEQEQRLRDDSATLKNFVQQINQDQKGWIEHLAENYKLSCELLCEKIQLEKDNYSAEIQRSFQSFIENQNLNLKELFCQQLAAICEKTGNLLAELLEHQQKLRRGDQREIFGDLLAVLTSEITSQRSSTLGKCICLLATESLQNPDTTQARAGNVVKPRPEEDTLFVGGTSSSISETCFPSIQMQDTTVVIDLTKDGDHDDQMMYNDKPLTADHSSDSTNLTSYNGAPICNRNVFKEPSAGDISDKLQKTAKQEKQFVESFDRSNPEFVSPMPVTKKRFLDQPENFGLKENKLAALVLPPTDVSKFPQPPAVVQKQCKELESKLHKPEEARSEKLLSSISSLSVPRTPSLSMARTPLSVRRTPSLSVRRTPSLVATRTPSLSVRETFKMPDALDSLKRSEPNLLSQFLDTPVSLRRKSFVEPGAKEPPNVSKTVVVEQKTATQSLRGNSSKKRGRKAADSKKKKRTKKIPVASVTKQCNKDEATKCDPFPCIQYNRTKDTTEASRLRKRIVSNMQSPGMEVFDFHDDTMETDDRPVLGNYVSKNVQSRVVKLKNSDRTVETQRITRSASSSMKVADVHKENLVPVGDISQKEMDSRNQAKAVLSIVSDDGRNIFEDWIGSDYDLSASSTSASSSPSFSISDILRRSEI